MVSRTPSRLHQRLQSLAAIQHAGMRPLRSLLYVPTSSRKFLEKSLVSSSDTVIYDLEDSVPSGSKSVSRDRLIAFLSEHDPSKTTRVAVRINSIGSGHEEEDIASLLSVFRRSPTRPVPVLVVPKVEHPSMLTRVATLVAATMREEGRKRRVPVIASIESAQSLINVESIADWRGECCKLSALLFAAEDYCASTSIARSPDRSELLYARSRIVNAAKAFGLSSIDMVCIDYKDADVLRSECDEGKRLGFDGKQAIHPSQVDQIQISWTPSESQLRRAALILSGMSASELESKGAFGLEIDGRAEMIDAPMVAGAKRLEQVARLLGVALPSV